MIIIKITIRPAQWQCLLPEQELLHHSHFQPDQNTCLCTHTVLCLFYSCVTFVLGFIHEEGDTIYCLKEKVWYHQFGRYHNIHLESTMACKSHRKHFHAKDLGVGVQIARHSLVPHLGRHFKLGRLIISLFFPLRLHHIKLVIHCLVLISYPLNEKNHQINSHLNVLLLLVSPIPPFSLHR